MSGLYFKYGTMNAAKSANLLMIGHNYEEEGFKVCYLKPAVDTREKEKDSKLNENEITISSRIGLSTIAYKVFPDDVNFKMIKPNIDIVLVDEVQFLTKEQVDALYKISFNKVVMCFGLLTDFKRNLFEGSKRLIELSDSIHEIKSICSCGKRAVVNARFKNGKIITEGLQIGIGGNESYKALCKECYTKLIK